MSNIKTLKNVNSVPDMEAIAQSIKTINRSVPATEDGAYTYFADNMKQASVVAENVTVQITEALTTLPTSLQGLKVVEAFAANIEKVNKAEKDGDVDAETAKKGRAQLQDKLNEQLSLIFTSFSESADNLSESANRLSGYAKKNEVRIKDAFSTETANHERAKSDQERESNRLDTLESRYEKLNEAVDEKRGGPLEDLIAIIPDEEELSGLMDVGAEDAAAPEVAAAKKAVELSISQIKKVLAVAEKTIEFMQLAEIRDEVFKATQAQRKIANASAERLREANNKIGGLLIVKSAGSAMSKTGDEVGKIVATFLSFVNDLKNMNGKGISESGISNSYDNMDSYLTRLRKAKSEVILG